MAGDWIKMRTNLVTHPKVVRMASALKADRLRIVGGLFAVWCLFDSHSEDGQLDGYTAEALDDLIGFPGFSAAMASVAWLAIMPDSLSVPQFDEHNGQSAKRRGQETERKREARKVSAIDADTLRTREEKRREEKNKDKHPSGVTRASKKCPVDFLVTEEMREWSGANFPAVDADKATERFIDHTFSRAITDWTATWRNWIRKDAEFSQAKGATPESFKAADDRRARARWEEMTGETHPDNIKTLRVIDAQPKYIGVTHA